MAICHISATIGSKSDGTSAAARFAYICREGKWGKPAMQKELLAVPTSGNMPAWAADNPARYWQAADAGERLNGRLFQQVIIALPRELPAPAQIALAESFARELARTPQGSLPYTVATHRGGTKAENPHAHIIVSERLIDGIDRTADTWFKRAAASPQKKAKNGKAAAERKTPDPENGGAKKSIVYQQPTWPEQLRSAWAERVNESLEVNHREERITPLSHVARGLDIVPTIKEGPPLRALEKQQKLSVRQAKNVAIRQINEQILAAKEELKKLTENISNFLKSVALEIAERQKQAAVKRAAKEKADAEAAREATKLERAAREKEAAAQAELESAGRLQEAKDRATDPKVERDAVPVIENPLVAVPVAEPLSITGVAERVMGKRAPLSPNAEPGHREEREMPAKVTLSESAEVSRQQSSKPSKAQERANTKPVQTQPTIVPSRPSVPRPATTKKAELPAVKPSPVQPPRPVDEFLEFLKEMPLEDAIRYLRALPLRAKAEEATAYSEFRVNGGYPTYERAPGNLWDDAKRDHKKLAADKQAAEKKLKKALAANEGWFGQKKDTLEIFEMKQGIAALDRAIEQKAATVQEYAERWKVEEPYYQQRAVQKNAKRAQARKFEPFIEAGKQCIDQIVQQKRREPKQQEKDRSLPSKGVEL